MFRAKKRRVQQKPQKSTQVASSNAAENKVPSNNAELETTKGSQNEDAKDDDGAANSSHVQKSSGMMQGRKRKMAKISSNIDTTSRSRAATEDEVPSHQQETPKVNKREAKVRYNPPFKKSLMCHQCQRNDKGDVVTCKSCCRKRFCMPCLASWYPQLKPEDVAAGCPVCRGNCNCKACLRSTQLFELDEEQMIEKDIEAKRKGLSPQKLNIEKSEYTKKERVYCDNCRTSIFDYHRFCRKCSFRLCLICCYELRNGELQGGADPVEFVFVNKGLAYLHGCEYKSRAERNLAHEDAKPDLKKKSAHSDVRGWSRSGWHAKSDGNIPCPKNECCNRFLELRSVLGPCYISKLVHQAEEASHKLHNSIENPVSWCSCLRFSRNNNNTLKAASRENSIDNFLYRTQSISQTPEDLKHFRYHWSRGEPIIVSNVLEGTYDLSWEPHVMWRAFRLTNRGNRNQHLELKAIDCLDWCQGKINIHQFFDGYTTGRMDSLNWPQMLRLNDWPPGFFKERAPRHCAEFLYSLPFKEYTHPSGGALNLASKVPVIGSTPDMGPKPYIAYGFPHELGRGDSVVKLHYDISDTVNVLTHTTEVRLTSDQLKTIEDLKRKHRDQDKRELHVSYQEENNILAGGNASDGVLWDVFRRQDIPMLKEYLKKHFREFRHLYCLPLDKVIHPIHDQSMYLTMEHKRKLKEEYGIEPWTFNQKLGDAVFIPAGCPYQVRNLKSCINVALSFVSPENVGECFRLTKEIRTLPINHLSNEDKLEVKKMTIFAMCDVVENLSRASMTEKLQPKTTIQEKQPTLENDKWDEYTTGIFLGVCVEEIDSGSRADAHFNEEGWINVIAKFNGKTGHNYDYRQLKDKWDKLKADFSLWTKLLEIGVGWDPVKRTVKASQEFWQARRKENPEFLKFRFQCPLHLDKLEACFKDMKAKGDVAMKTNADPSSAEVRVYGKENEDNLESRVFAAGFRDSDSVAHQEPHTSYSVEHTTSNDNPKKRQIQLQHSNRVPLEKHSIPLEVTHRRATQENEKWDDFTTGVFLEICVHEIAAGNWPHADFNKEGWNNVIAKFNEKTGQNYDHRQLKKELDNLKNEFILWAKLVENQTGLRWDPIKRTVKAPPEFWESKEKENPEFLKFKHQGPAHLDKLEACFKDAKDSSYVPIYEDPSSIRVGFHGEENEDNIKIRASNEDDADSGDVAIEETHHMQNVQHGKENENNPELRASDEGFGDGDDVAIEETHHMDNVEPTGENENNPELRASDEGFGDGDGVAVDDYDVALEEDDAAIEATHHMDNVEPTEENKNNPPELRASNEGFGDGDGVVVEDEVAIEETHHMDNVEPTEENKNNPELRASDEVFVDGVAVEDEVAIEETHHMDNVEPTGENENNLELRASDEGFGDGDGDGDGVAVDDYDVALEEDDVAIEETHHMDNVEPTEENKNNPELRASDEVFVDGVAVEDEVAIEETHHMDNVEPTEKKKNNPELRVSGEGISSADVVIDITNHTHNVAPWEENGNNPELRASDEGVSGIDVDIDKTHNVDIGKEDGDNPELRASHEGDGDSDGVGIAIEETYHLNNVEPLGENEDNLELRASDEGVEVGDGVVTKETLHSHNAESGPSNSVPKKRKGVEVGDGVVTKETLHSHNAESGPSNSVPKKRKRLRKAKNDSRKAAKPQHSLNHAVDELTTDSVSYLDLDICLTLLDSVPGLEKGSTLYFIACRVLTKVVNRQTFVHLMRDEPKLAFGWLNTFSLEDLKYLTG